MKDNRINIEKISSIFQSALNSKVLVDKEDTALIFYDLTFLEEKIRELKLLFPAKTLHAIAIKANPLISNLRFIRKYGVGAEAASLPEIYLALQAGFKPGKIMFDSPAKTKDEIIFALRKGININADSFTELELIKEFITRQESKSKIGIRINPQIGIGEIQETSVAGEYSKFGVPIKEYRKELQKYFFDNDWLRGVHLHIGSQGISLEMLLNGAKVIYDFVSETNNILLKNFKKPVNQFDIGGGLPVPYYPGDEAVSLKEYCFGLKRNYPDLFTNKFSLITEFGRYIYANSAWAVSRAEYVKINGRTKTAVIHLGADMFLREAYMPGKWHHEIFVLDKKGKIKNNREMENYIVVGPLCFAGDVIGKEILLPEIEPGDFVVIKDVGAYTLSMWSRYNSRQIPKIIGYNKSKKFLILKKREEINKIIDFWS